MSESSSDDIHSAAPEERPTSTQQDALARLFSNLDGEAQQEQDLASGGISRLAGLDAELLRGREREFKDVVKHYVRKYIWLKAANGLVRQKRQKVGQGPHAPQITSGQAQTSEAAALPGNYSGASGRGLRYLTLPAYYRLDVSLLHREGLIEVTHTDANGEPDEIYVAAFEEDPDKYGRMAGQTPRYKLFGLGRIEDVLVDDSNPYYYDLQQLFPFDIVNLDLTASLVPTNEGPYSKTLRAIDTIFRRQADLVGPWALFLTFRNMPEEWEQRALQQLYSNLQRNLVDHAAVREIFYERYRKTEVAGLQQEQPATCVSQAVAKWLIDRAHYQGHDLQSMESYRYQRRPEGIRPYHIYKHVLVFKPGQVHPSVPIPTTSIPIQTWMLDDLVQCIKKHVCHDVEEIVKARDSSPRPITEEIEAEIEALCALIT